MATGRAWGGCGAPAEKQVRALAGRVHGYQTLQATTLLDVRPVAPKPRFETIMSAYRSLIPGRTMELVVDHDPTCMYYTLKAKYGDALLTFQYLERGPETWRVHVTKQSA